MTPPAAGPGPRRDLAAVTSVAIAAAVVHRLLDVGPGEPVRGAGPLGGPVRRLASAIVPQVVDLVDVDGVVGSVDVDAVIGRVDVDAVVQRVDVDALLGRVDVDRLVARIDLDALLAQVDVDALVARIDVDALVARIDADALVSAIDLDDLVSRIDVAGLVERLDLPAIVAANSRGLGERALDALRAQLLAADVLVDHAVARLRSPAPDDDPAAPATAGPASRLAAHLADLGLLGVVLAGASFVLSFLADALGGVEVDAADPAGPGWPVALGAVAFLYYWVGYVVAGRTPGKALAGLRVERADGARVGALGAAVRIVVLPVAMGLAGLGLVGVVVGRRHRGLHDVAAGTVVVHRWGDRPAALPAAVARYVAGGPDPI